MSSKNIFAIFYILTFLFPIDSQAKELQFESIGVDQEFSSSSILEIIQDKKGFLWLGTGNGLYRYDGYEFTSYIENPYDSLSISGSYITALFEDKSRAIWIGTNGGGLNKYNHFLDRFTSYKNNPENAESISSNKIWFIFEDSNMSLWIGTGNGLNLMNRETGKFSHWNHELSNENSLSHNTVIAISEDKNNIIWIGTEYGLNRFDKETNKFIRYYHNSSDPLSISDNTILSIFKDRNKILWIGTTKGGLNKLNWDGSGDVQFIHYQHKKNQLNGISSNKIQTIAQDNAGRLWIGTGDGGLSIFYPDTERFEVFKKDETSNSQIADNTIFSILKDRSNVMWLGTLMGGLQKVSLKRRAFKNYKHDPQNLNSLNDNVVTTIYEDTNGKIWIGTWEGGLNKFDPDTEAFTHYKHNSRDSLSLSRNYVKAIHEDNSGYLWVGVWDNDGGLNKFDKKKEIFKHYKHDPNNPTSLSSNKIRSINSDKEGNIWIGTTNGGLNKLDVKKEEFFSFKPHKSDSNSISDDDVMSILIENDSILWIATWSGGVNKLNIKTNQFVHYESDPQNPKSLSNNRVWSIYKDLSGRIWVCTSGGLNLFIKQNENFIHFTDRQGLPSNVILGILEDEKNNLWISTSNGLSKFNPETKSFTNYYTRDGLSSNSYNPGAFCKRKNGEMYFGGSNGFTIFNPDSIKPNSHPPEIVLTSFKIFEEEVQLDTIISQIRKIELPYNDRFFSFGFAALDFQEPEKNQYAYKLEGFHDEWIYSGSRRYVNFSNLNSGSYVFQVKGSDNHGIWNENATSLNLIVLPPIWRTWWAYLIYIILVAGFAMAGRWVVINWRSLISIRAKKISHYKLLELLGKGGMGEVYKAIDMITKDIVALKILNQELTDDPENKRRLSNEGRLLTSFSSPHIVKVFEVGETENHGFIAMEYLTGGSLKEYLNKNKPLPLEQVKNFILQICKGLEEIHDMGIIHRDIKTANIMLDEIGNIRIMDFGLSKSPLVKTMTTIGTVLGTLGYVAPEQITGIQLDHRVDIFSFGVVIYELLTEHMPFGGENEIALIHSIFNTIPSPPSELREYVSSDWDTLVACCIAKNPQNRYQNINELNDAIQKIAV